MESINTHTGSRMNLLGSQPAKETIDFFSAEKQVTADTPPAFIFLAVNDKAVSVMNSILFFQALLDKNVPAELHLFQSGGHGFGLWKGGTESAWTELCARWLSARGLIK
jgi:acetyl esterase/lipase